MGVHPGTYSSQGRFAESLGKGFGRSIDRLFVFLLFRILGFDSFFGVLSELNVSVGVAAVGTESKLVSSEFRFSETRKWIFTCPIH